MKNILLIFAFAFAASAQALPENVFDPEQFCGFGCTPAQNAIWQGFVASEYRPAAAPAVYSGECYHTSAGYDGTHAHHGVYFSSEVNGEMRMSGSFSFFAPADPFAGMTAGQAAERFGDHATKTTNIVTRAGKNGLLNFTTNPEMPWLYWMRHSPDGKKLWLLAQWGTAHVMFCGLNAH